MPKKQFEIEVKVLLGSKNAVDTCLAKLRKRDPHFLIHKRSSQLNHYFLSGNVEKLLTALSPFLKRNTKKELSEILKGVTNYSLRTRWEDGKTTLVAKASTHGKDSVHDLKRREFETILPLSIEELDKLLLSSGFSYQSKWSRVRNTYSYKDLTVCIDKNAGYGYLAEFEKVIYNEKDVEKAKKAILAELTDLDLEELPNDRLNRMFSYYNAHWQEYYQTEVTFIVE
ncbi:hypothetical protein HYW55_02100 [Candidatus Gottesmanbacteria bacterium]|nr:hypothetical protein [Candidatus Gottesmanbacteria bacterium]